MQHLLRKHSIEVFNVIDKQKGHIYVCGDVKMAEQVGETFVDIIAKEGEMTHAKAETVLKTMRVSRINYKKKHKKTKKQKKTHLSRIA